MASYGAASVPHLIAEEFNRTQTALWAKVVKDSGAKLE